MNTKKQTETMSTSSSSLAWLKGKRLAFIGDSITAELRWNYVTLVVDRIADQVDVGTMTIVNSGVDSSSILDALDRLPEVLIEHDPEVLVVFVGVNDSKIFRSTGQPLMPPKVFAESYANFLDQVDHIMVRRKVLVTPPPLLFKEIEAGDLLKDYWYWEPTLYMEYIKAIRKLEIRPSCVIADAYMSFSKQSVERNRLFDVDGVHPSIYGHRLIADVVLNALRSLGNGPS